MPWGAPVLGAQLTTVRVGIFSGALLTTAARINGLTAPTVEQTLGSPFTKGLLELNSSNKFAAVGTSPEFPIGPKWRKVVRQIG